MKVKILVVEDEIIIADSICDFLVNKGFKVFEPVVSFDEAISSIIKNKPDVVLLDIRLRGSLTGIDLAKELNEHFKIPFIFLTSNSDDKTLNSAINTSPSAFLIKPLNSIQIFAAIELAVKNQPFKKEFSPPVKYIYIHNGKEYIKALFDDILFLKSDNVYIEVHLKNDNRIITRSSMSKFLKFLSLDFLQVHRSYIVNTNNLDKVGKSTVTICENEIPIGEKYKKALNENFKSNVNVTN